ncbi:sigma factor-like helix-turn-helix DNA-binding protein [Kitasatospora sp. NPDC002965]|uniref:RNA polymerase sigma factor n=1 Tax=Kitasatospora sp. NPDC002965 TaxID=3154775 RepID=UPI0033B22DD8
MSDDPLFAIGPDQPGHDPESGQWGAAVELPVDGMPLEYEAFTLTHRPSYLCFAQEILGDPGVAGEVVHEVLVQLAIDWPEALRSPDIVVTAWGMLCHAIRAEVRRRDRDPQLLVRLARLRTTLDRMRAALPDTEATTAADRDPDADTDDPLMVLLATLSPRQFDVVILKAHGRSTHFIAWFLGTHPSTVDRNLARALARLDDGLRPLRLLHPGTPDHRRGERR